MTSVQTDGRGEYKTRPTIRPEVGDRVRVVLEGDVRAVGHGGLSVGPTRTANFIIPSAAHVVSVEVLAPPEPEWEPGDVARLDHEFSAYSESVIYGQDDVWRDLHGVQLDLPSDRLTLLVRGGEIVGGASQ